VLNRGKKKRKRKKGKRPFTFLMSTPRKGGRKQNSLSQSRWKETEKKEGNSPHLAEEHSRRKTFFLSLTRPEHRGKKGGGKEKKRKSNSIPPPPTTGRN